MYPVTRDEQAARTALAQLARDERGRRLLQLALRGVHESGRGLTLGCWTATPGGSVSGCIFQHAYWQGVAEGVFEPADRAATEIRHYVADEDFRVVMGAIRSLDQLGRRRFLKWSGFRRVLDEPAWRDAVERLLVDALAGGAAATSRPAEPASAR
jgi:hypothetical protein